MCVCIYIYIYIYNVYANGKWQIKRGCETGVCVGKNTPWDNNTCGKAQLQSTNQGRGDASFCC